LFAWGVYIMRRDCFIAIDKEDICMKN